MKMQNTLIIAALTFVAGSAFAAITPTLNDGQILQLIKTTTQANTNEAQLEVTEGSNTEIKNYAVGLVADNTKSVASEALVEAESGIKAGDSDANKSLQNTTSSKLASMKTIARSNIDRAFIDDQVATNQAYVNDLNTILIPQAQNAQVKSFLQDTLKTVQGNLTAAQKAQADLEK